MAGQGRSDVRRRAAWIMAILALALAARLAAGAWWQQRLPPGQELAFGDSDSYWRLAQSLYRGEPFQYGSPDSRIFRTPGYPALLAALFKLLGTDDPPVLAVRALSATCGAAAVGVVMALGWRLFRPEVGLLAGLVAAVHPEAIALGTFVLSEAPFHPLMLLNIFCLREAWAAASSHDSARRATAWALAAGVAAGLATLMRPSWLLFTPYLLLLALLTASNRRCAARLALPLIVSLAATMAPWWLRNYEAAGRFVPTTLQVGASLYDGWRPDADGASDMRFVPEFYAAQKAADAAATEPLTGTFEERLDRRHREAAVAWAKQNPRRVVELAWIKLRRMWSPLPNAAEMGGTLLRAATFCGYVPTMLLAVYGTLRLRRSTVGLWLLWIPALYLTNLHVIFVSSLRYRQPALLLLIVVAAAAAWEWRAGRAVKEPPR